MHNTKRRVAGLLLMAAFTLAVPRAGCLVPPAACRFARYLAASRNQDVSLSDRVVYSFILATHAHPAHGDRS